MDLTNAALLKTSKSYRDQNPEMLLPSSSDDDFSVDLSATNSPIPPTFVSASAPPQTFSGFLVKMNSSQSTPVLTKLPTPPSITMSRPKTALDVLNDTIIKSLGSSPTPSSPIKPMHTSVPLNLVKIMPSPSQNDAISQTLVVTPKSLDIVKKEPDSSDVIFNGVDPTETCIASGMGGHCVGPLLNVNKLTAFRNAITGQQVATDDGSSAMERAIIKSRMRIPFWKADEVIQTKLMNHFQNNFILHHNFKVFFV